jgi:large subunit ribosomal protein L36e
LIRKVVREVVGFSPYEKRAMELVKGGGSNGNKRAMRLVKRRLGSMKRAKKKMAELQGFIEAGM